MKKTMILCLLCILVAGCNCNKQKDTALCCETIPANQTWEQQFDEVLPLLGHRNWILVVDKAFPLQSANGMTYIDTQSEFLPALNTVIGKINQASHVQAILYTDAELKYLTEDLVPGIDDFRNKLYKSLEGGNVQTLNHNDIFERLDAASKLFSVVVIKTESVMPYTSVFIELDCGYWSAEKENRLRELMKQ